MDERGRGDGGSSWPRGRARDGGVDEIRLPQRVDGAVRGRLWLCGKHAVAPDPIGALAAIGADMIVCLNERGELIDRYPHYVRWLVEHVAERALWFPVPDLHAPTLAETAALIGRLRSELDSGRSLLVHCGAGIGRAGTVAVCLLIELGVDEPEALARVADERPMAGPEAGAQRALVADFARLSRS